MFDAEWLLRDATDDLSLTIGERSVVDDTRWRAVIERVDLGDGLRVFLTDAAARRDITIELRDNRADLWLGAQVTCAGRAEIDFLDGGHTHASMDQALLFRAPGYRAAYRLEAGTHFLTFGYSLSLDRIHRLFGGEAPAALRALLEPELDRSRILPMRGTPRMRRLAAELAAPGLNGPLRRIAMEGVVIQLLAIQAAAAEPRSQALRRPVSRRERQVLNEARQRLLADMRHPPSLGDLALMVGLTEKRLNAGFRALFGTSVFNTLRDERLEHARVALETGQASLKDVAFRVGYNHANNFISAFAARYGAPPRRYLDRASSPEFNAAPVNSRGVGTPG